MKKFVYAITLAALAVGDPGFAQDPAYFDNIGIYLDEAATINCDVLPPGTHAAFLVLTKLTSNEVAGWDCKLTFDNLFLTGITLRGGGIELASRPDEHIVGLTFPLPAVNGQVVVADLELLVSNGTIGMAYVDEVYFSMMENGLPSYMDASGIGHSLYPANSYTPGWSGGMDVPIFVSNGDCVTVGNEEVSFGSVKGLFR